MSLGSILLCLWFVYVLFQRHSLGALARSELWGLGFIFFWFLVLSAVLFVRVPWAEALDRMRPLPLFLILFLPLLRPLDREGFWWVLKWTFVAYMVNICVSGYQYFFEQIEGVGFFKNPIYFAYNVFPAFLFIGLFVRFQGSFLKTYKIPMVASFLFLGVAFSNNRMTLALSLLLLAYCYLPRLYKRWGWRGVSALCFILILLLGVMYHTNPWLHDKLVRTSWGLAGPSIQARLVAWSHNWDLFVANPLFGVGYSLNGINTAEFVELQKHWRPGHDIFAHSIFFQSLAESGIVGTALLFGGLLLLARGRFFLQRFFLFMAIAGLTENFLHNSKPLMAFLFFGAMAVNVSKLSQAELEEP